jgi:eukaryotic-like serine/threonine-protein kinase
MSLTPDPDPASPVRFGEIVSGRYRVERVLGSGGMGVVVKATHLTLERHVALKFMRTDLFEHEHEARSRFMREARAAAKLHSDHVARVLDVGTLDGGEIYLALEYLEGSDLGKRVRELGALAPEQAVLFVLMACHAIAEAHMNGIIHRDLKAENVFLVEATDGSTSIKVLDFGISKVAETNAADASITCSGGSPFIGSPLTMSPEQMTAPLEVDARADVWGIGTLLFHLLTGRDAFDAPSASAVCAKVLHGASPSVRGLCPEIAPALDAVVQRCLEKKREDRYQDVAELAEALAPFAPPEGATYPERIATLLGKSPASSEARAATEPDVEPDALEVATPPAVTPGPSARPRAPSGFALKLAVAAVLATAIVVVLRDRARGGPISTALGIVEDQGSASAAPQDEPLPTTATAAGEAEAPARVSAVTASPAEPTPVVAPEPSASSAVTAMPTSAPAPAPATATAIPAPNAEPRARRPARSAPPPPAPEVPPDELYPGAEPPAALPPVTPEPRPAAPAPEPPLFGDPH